MKRDHDDQQPAAAASANDDASATAKRRRDQAPVHQPKMPVEVLLHDLVPHLTPECIHALSDTCLVYRHALLPLRWETLRIDTKKKLAAVRDVVAYYLPAEDRRSRLTSPMSEVREIACEVATSVDAAATQAKEKSTTLIALIREHKCTIDRLHWADGSSLPPDKLCKRLAPSLRSLSIHVVDRASIGSCFGELTRLDTIRSSIASKKGGVTGCHFVPDGNPLREPDWVLLTLIRRRKRDLAAADWADRLVQGVEAMDEDGKAEAEGDQAADQAEDTTQVQAEIEVSQAGDAEVGGDGNTDVERQAPSAAVDTGDTTGPRAADTTDVPAIEVQDEQGHAEQTGAGQPGAEQVRGGRAGEGHEDVTGSPVASDIEGMNAEDWDEQEEWDDEDDEEFDFDGAEFDFEEEAERREDRRLAQNLPKRAADPVQHLEVTGTCYSLLGRASLVSLGAFENLVQLHVEVCRVDGYFPLALLSCRKTLKRLRIDFQSGHDRCQFRDGAEGTLPRPDRREGEVEYYDCTLEGLIRLFERLDGGKMEALEHVELDVWAIPESWDRFVESCPRMRYAKLVERKGKETFLLPADRA
ncbi:uncharacterized protein PFL1_04927 [Pseudozyma flocculosa PF-1]|uniref:Uncharacterized protein n=2 Tax=Pseudozyma flocculosa TaxID=84751 RepID=A0A5C3EWP6_9BASI|nr:uncharacterized protein PFL1_04927 [Pseudozyma flocculosa PF-1]EPQ27388.1 hypothetical protein PFL1_04927 [Pseudozyma flocculosa PF-1]SPO36195.1 uncharacterized protein PSFLO_01666 [Pseudozyma flocculosa]